MTSTLTPREIQARIRSGESLADVALASGVPVDRIESFAAPVIAEREHMAISAQSQPVRRGGETVAHQTLRSVVAERLLSRGVDVDSLEWDAWRLEDRRWIVALSYVSGSARRLAEFLYDPRARFSVAQNDDARWLLGEQSASHGPQPGKKRRLDDPDAEPTLDLYDELALVRAVQPDIMPEPLPDSEDAYVEVELAEVDGIYDLVDEHRPMDVLYDMLASFDEDSVQIYAGLISPDEPTSPIEPIVDVAPSAFIREVDEPPAQAQQKPLLEVVGDVPTDPTKARPRKKRAQVPTWDEIVFGSPRKD